MAGHKLAKITIDDLDMIGYSVAAEETVIGMPQLDVCFDVGKAPDQIIPINNLLLTHGHIDHAAGLAYYLSHRNFCDIKPGRVLAPACLLKDIQQILDVWGRLDGSRIPCELIGVKPGDEYPVKPNLFVRVFPTKHSRGAVGFTVIEKRKKLKAEYIKLTGPQIVDLKKQGVEIENKIEIPIVSYFGDTQYADFDKLDYIANSKILIIECTFYEDEHRDRARMGRHMYVDELAQLVARMNNEHIVITHVTHRTSVAAAKKILKKAMRESDYAKVRFLMDRRNLL